MDYRTVVDEDKYGLFIVHDGVVARPSPVPIEGYDVSDGGVIKNEKVCASLVQGCSWSRVQTLSGRDLLWFHTGELDGR